MIRLGSTGRAIVYGASFVVMYVCAVCTPIGQELDAVSLGVFPYLRVGVLVDLFATRGWVMLLLVGSAAALAIIRLAQRRARQVVPALALVPASAVSARFLKDVVLGRPDLGDFSYIQNTFPSGHVAISLAAALAICWLLADDAPGWLALPLGSAAVCVSLFSVLSLAHRVSDVVGAAVLVGMLAAIVGAVSGQRRTALLWAPALVGAAAATALTLVASVALRAANDVSAALVGAAFILATLASVSVVMVSEGRLRLPVGDARVAPATA